MNNTNPNGIGEIMVPEAIKFTFNAPGWIFMGCFLLLIAMIFLIKRYLQYRKDKYRRIAVQSLEKLLDSSNDHNALIFEFVLMLKKVAIVSFGKESVGNLTGKLWIDFLRRKSEKHQLWTGSEYIFSTQLYQDQKEILESEELDSFYEDSINWIKYHRV